MYLSLLVMALASQAPGQAEGQVAAQVSEQQDTEATADVADDPVICKRGEAVTGSRIRKSRELCYTKSRWAEIEAHSKELAREMREGNINPEAGKPHVSAAGGS